MYYFYYKSLKMIKKKKKILFKLHSIGKISIKLIPASNVPTVINLLKSVNCLIILCSVVVFRSSRHVNTYLINYRLEENFLIYLFLIFMYNIGRSVQKCVKILFFNFYHGYRYKMQY